MPRGFKRDNPETHRMYREGKFLSKFSLLSLPKESEHGFVAHLLLDGADVSAQRGTVYRLANGVCKHCGKFVDEDSGDMCHVENGAGKRCDCLANLYWAHHSCHFEHDHPERM